VNTGYDSLNLPVSGYNGATFGYDNLGRMTSATVAGQTLSFGYNALNQPTSESSAQRTVTREFDLNGNRKRLVYPDNYAVTYHYDAVGALSSITDPASTVLMSVGYDNLGRPTGITRH
jgi:YD repeat-containing protein